MQRVGAKGRSWDRRSIVMGDDITPAKYFRKVTTTAAATAAITTTTIILTPSLTKIRIRKGRRKKRGILIFIIIFILTLILIFILIAVKILTIFNTLLIYYNELYKTD